MAIYVDSKPGIGDVYPAGASEETWRRTEPLLSPEQLVARHLFGISLVSMAKDPITGRAQVMNRDMLADYIDRAVSMLELETGIIVMPTAFKERLPFDKFEYASFGYMRLPKRPVSSIERLTIAIATNHEVFLVPLDWVDVGQLYHGQLNLIPLTLALGSSNSQGALVSSAGGPALMAMLHHAPWVPSWWQISYTAGFPDGKVPKIINDLIGTVVAMDALSMLAPTHFRNQSASLSIDGYSQSISGPGVDIFKRRMEELQGKREMLVKKIKALFGLTLFSGNV